MAGEQEEIIQELQRKVAELETENGELKRKYEGIANRCHVEKSSNEFGILETSAKNEKEQLEKTKKDNGEKKRKLTTHVEHNLSRVSETKVKVRSVSLNVTKISAKNLLKHLDKYSMLNTFSFTGTWLEEPEWTLILKKLAELNLQGIDVSNNILEQISRNLNVSLMKLSGNPGVAVEEFKKGIEFGTVKTLAVEELKITKETDVEQFLEVLPQSFPCLQTLIWDWKIVDPERKLNERTTNILKKLIDVHQKLNLKVLAIVSLTLDPATKSAIEEMSRALNGTLNGVQLLQFATKTRSGGWMTKSLIQVGRHGMIAKEFAEMYIKFPSTIPHMGDLLQLCEEDIGPAYHPSLYAEPSD